MELARSYIPIASDGRARATYAVKEVLEPNGDGVYGGGGQPTHSVIPADAAWMLRDMLAGVIDNGTGRNVRAAGYDYRASGKTGTTNEERDAWFVGFDREYLAVVWVGYDDNRPTGFTGGRAAAPIWANLMKEVRRGRPPPTDRAPSTISIQEVCEDSGCLATRACPNRVEEVFFTGHLPSKSCPIHGRPMEQTRQNVRSWLERIFGGGNVNIELDISD